MSSFGKGGDPLGGSLEPLSFSGLPNQKRNKYPGESFSKYDNNFLSNPIKKSRDR